jgi:cell wall-associated NlpC family hydrolase
MHFLPAEWRTYAADGNGDDVMNPDNMYDGAIAAAKKLCALAEELPGSTGSLASAAVREQVAEAFVHGTAQLPTVAGGGVGATGTEAVAYGNQISTQLDGYGKVLEDADERIAKVVSWMREQIQLGARYAATNPGRFGTAWDGVPKRSFISDRIYQYPTGTITYDCSGLMVVGFRQIGVDLADLGATWTGAMLANLPRVARDDIQVGDLIILRRNGRTSHVVMYLGHDRYIHAGSCGGTMGVCEREGVDWSRVAGIVRVPLGPEGMPS